MKYNRIFHLTYLFIVPFSLFGVYTMNMYLILFSNIAITTSFITIFKVQGNLTSKKSANILFINFISFAICEFLGLLRDNIFCFFLTFLFGLIIAISAFAFLDAGSNWRKKALSHKNMLYALPILLVLFFIVEKFVLPSMPNTVFFPATITIILLIIIFVIAFFRETNKKSYYYITIACAFFIIALMFSAKIPTKLTAYSPLVVVMYVFYLAAKFYWVQGCIWSLKSPS
jgi:hypothetical protein